MSSFTRGVAGGVLPSKAHIVLSNSSVKSGVQLEGWIFDTAGNIWNISRLAKKQAG